MYYCRIKTKSTKSTWMSLGEDIIEKIMHGINKKNIKCNTLVKEKVDFYFFKIKLCCIKNIYFTS